MMMAMFQAVLLAGCLVTLTWGYSSGPPRGRCGDLYPTGHQVDAQQTSTPFVINVTATQYAPGDTITVTVGGNRMFKGLFLQARSTNCSNTNPLGSFVLNNMETSLQLLNCSAVDDSVGHNNNINNTVKSFTWNAPSQASGHLYFRATFVESKSVFWTTTFSQFISDMSDTSSLPSQPCAVRTQLNPGNGSSPLMMHSFIVYLCCVWLLLHLLR